MGAARELDRSALAQRGAPFSVYIGASHVVVAFLFWAATGLIAYHHVIYPVLVRVLIALGASRRSRVLGDIGFRPTVTIIVPAHNEAAVIEAKIHNLAALSYPHDRLAIVVALDGCTDATGALAENALGSQRTRCITLTEYQPNVGKVAVLNDQIARARSEIVALTDTSALVADDALLRGVAYFADSTVGVVTGRYSVAGLEGHGEASYWRYQSDLRAGESALAGPVGAHGAFYMFRRSAWTPLPADTINDDFVLPMSIVLRGFKAVFEPEIIATELEGSRSRQEFRRRIRIGAGNLQQVIRLAKLGDPRRGWVAFAFLSGKGIRGVLPFLIVAILCATLILAIEGSSTFASIAIVELLAIAFAIWGGRIPRMREGRLSGTLLYALEGYLALAIGVCLILLRRGSIVWRLSKASAGDRQA